MESLGLRNISRTYSMFLSICYLRSYLTYPTPLPKYDMHRQRQQRLIARFTALRQLTNKAFTENAKQLELKACELNQITDAAITLRKYLLSTEDGVGEVPGEGTGEDDMHIAGKNNPMENPHAK